MKKLVALALVVAFGSVYTAAPVLAGEGPVAATEMSAPAAPVMEPAPSSASGPGWMHVGGGEKNPLVPGLMSLCVPCTGQWYNGELMTWKTAAMAALEAGSIFVLVFFAAGGAGHDARMVCMAGAGGMILTHAWSGYDAWSVAKQKNQGIAMELDKSRALVSYNVPF